ncbi:prepilin peptidase [Ensifer sp. HO-A22]|uniref:Prepilin peptidase n=1 Tax=Ensifer oleiphilus TaxID=2742698 RepID=A0A7Y6Q1P5_9HYPH|nr:prepilin peptidase [Ensifer oleiphilus]NVD37240.1 prepilin peptidase [Ensifer oleiphilus]
MPMAAVFVVLPLCLAYAAISDVLTMTIPNRISVLLIVAFLATAPLVGLDLRDIGIHLAAGGAVFGVCFVLFALNVMGGGDAKLLTSVAVWFGLGGSLVAFLVYVAFFGGLLTIAILLLRMQESRILAIGIPVPRLLFTAKKIPYGVAIAIGGLVAYPGSPLVLKALSQLSS